ncbi:hypothetical protein [Streptosporangium sp. NPDC000396]
MDELVDRWTVLSDEAGLVNIKQVSTRNARLSIGDLGELGSGS